ncbi:hypothetical protein N656DRAFT_479053 [Canariomyces notabilis]|uniref:Uncharacterized protein n=1 Tax=Canariomyces notabilis TaxID=2074819 RepID=A0AAN6YUZ1_9PEZI|nr:hypothetical protein N656DRAFT_479053 [Canariomyces arenarius]
MVSIIALPPLGSVAALDPAVRPSVRPLIDGPPWGSRGMTQRLMDLYRPVSSSPVNKRPGFVIPHPRKLLHFTFRGSYFPPFPVLSPRQRRQQQHSCI